MNSNNKFVMTALLHAAETERDELAAKVARVEALAESWHSRGEHDMKVSNDFPEDVQEVIYNNGADLVEKARLVRNALWGIQ